MSEGHTYRESGEDSLIIAYLIILYIVYKGSSLASFYCFRKKDKNI